MPITSSTSSPPGSGFTPRKEFIRDQHSTPNSFAILALSSSNFIRLYSFSPSVIDNLLRHFEKQNINIACREDLPHNLHEISIDQKPWANPKSVFSEKLLLDIFTVIYKSGYTFLSCIDYGREPDDRLAMAFSKPSTATPSVGSRTGTPLLSNRSPALDGSHSSLHEKVKISKRIPFALSFSSTTVMRVISPPLHLTPAILQAVRGSWPRGVVSEKKVADNCFEFKLKGYKWFQEDNFASDSLQHILSLLTSLDAHSFTLLTSVTFTNRSRIKDLWIFTGPSQAGGDTNADDEHTPESRRLFGEASNGSVDIPPAVQHRRHASDGNLPAQSTAFNHIRSATEDMSQRHQNNGPRSNVLPNQPHVLRKPAPRAQVPVSAIQESEPEGEEGGYAHAKANLPSMISSNSPNMTGVGAIGQGQNEPYPYALVDRSSPFSGLPHSPFTPPVLPTSPSPSEERPSQPSSEGSKTPPLLTNSPPASPRRKRFGSQSESDSMNEKSKSISPIPHTLLSPGTFRDSGLSSQSDITQDIPIKWTGSAKEGGPTLDRMHTGSATSPSFPGGWQATPIDERKESERGFFDQPESTVHTPIYETLSRINSPEVVQPNVALRKSEAVVFGMIAATSPTPPLPLSPPRSSPIPQDGRVPSKTPSDQPFKKEGPTHGGQGWVLVNVEGAAPSHAELSASPHMTHDALFTPTPHLSNNTSTPHQVQSPSPQDQPSPTAKAIVIMDAIDSKHKKSRSASANKELGEGGVGVRRFFSLNRKNSRRKLREDESDSDKQRERTLSGSKLFETTVHRSPLRDRLRVPGTPEAARKEDNNRSLIE